MSKLDPATLIAIGGFGVVVVLALLFALGHARLRAPRRGRYR